MNASRYNTLLAARSRLGSAFQHHYEPDDNCNGGRVTTPDCMERGLGNNERYDCSGLVIASLCQVLGINVKEWPREYRHANQLADLEERTAAEIGDVLIFHPAESSYGIHMGILAATLTVIHASGKTKSVTEGKVNGKCSRIGIVPTGMLLELGFETHARILEDDNP